MKNKILIVGGIATLILALLWYFEKITEPLFTIGALIITVIGYLFVPETMEKTILSPRQKHKGQGDNVYGNKTINNNYVIKEAEKNDLKISNISAIDIKNAIDDSPLYQREGIAKHYHGIRVRWKVTLYSILSKAEGNNIVKLMTRYEGGYPWVYFYVDLSHHPSLKFAKRGKELLVTGVVKSFSSNDCDIEFENLEEI